MADNVAKYSDAALLVYAKNALVKEQEDHKKTKKALKDTVKLLKDVLELIDIEKDEDSLEMDIENHLKELKRKKLI